MADRSDKGPFVALSLCVASRTSTRFFVIYFWQLLQFLEKQFQLITLSIWCSGKDVKIEIFPVLIIYWSRFEIFKQNRGNPDEIGIVGQSAERKLIQTNAECKLLVHCSRSRTLSIPSYSQPLANFFTTVPVIYYFALSLKCQELQLLNQCLTLRSSLKVYSLLSKCAQKI